MPLEPFQLAYVPFQNNAAFYDWLRNHGEWHQILGREAIRLGNSNLVTYRVIDFGDKEDWLYFHNEEHVKIARFFNSEAVPDLSYLDFDDLVNWSNWHSAHALVHVQARRAARV